MYTFFGPFNRPRRLLKGWHLFPFHSVYEAFFAQLCKSAAKESNKIKARNGEVNWYCPKEQSLVANDIRGLMAPKFCRHLSYS